MAVKVLCCQPIENMGEYARGSGGEGEPMMKIDRKRRTAEDLRSELRAFEERYRVATPDLESAFMSRGVLRETEDYARWSLLRAAYRRSSGTARVT